MMGFARYPPARALSLAEGLEIAAGAHLLPNQGESEKSDNSAINTIKRHKGDLSTMGFSISYAPLWQTLKDRGLKKIDLVRLNIITPSALKKMEKTEPVSLNAIGKIAVTLGVGAGDVVEFVRGDEMISGR